MINQLTIEQVHRALIGRYASTNPCGDDRRNHRVKCLRSSHPDAVKLKHNASSIDIQLLTHATMDDCWMLVMKPFHIHPWVYSRPTRVRVRSMLTVVNEVDRLVQLTQDNIGWYIEPERVCQHFDNGSKQPPGLLG